MAVTLGRVLQERGTDVLGNLAIEEAILALAPGSGRKATVRFWRNGPSVVLGRGQAVDAEVNVAFCRARGITVARRASGGGAVYHDTGNVNASFFVERALLPVTSAVSEINAFFTGILLDSLEATGLDGLEARGGSNIFHHGKKVSGSAGRHKATWILHHATLLVGADLGSMDGALLAKPGDPGGGTSSVPSPTANLPPFDLAAWERHMVAILAARLVRPVTFEPGVLDPAEEALAARLHVEKYGTPGWTLDGHHGLACARNPSSSGSR